MSSKNLEQEILEELELEKAAKVDKKSKKEADKNSSASRKRRANPFTVSFILLVTGIWVGCGLMIAALELGVSRQITQKAASNHIETLQASAKSSIDLAFKSTQQELDLLANSDEVRRILAEDRAQPELHTDQPVAEPATPQEMATPPEDKHAALIALLKGGFLHSVSLLPIPWDHTGTAGLKNRNIPTRNSIEIMMVTKAADRKEVLPEAYLHNKEWLISFISPVIQNDQVIGVLLLTLNKDFLFELINKPYYTDSASMSVINQQQKDKPLASAGNVAGAGSDLVTTRLTLPFTGGELVIQIDPAKSSASDVPFILIYLVIAVVSALLTLVAFIVHLLNIRAINQNCQAMTRYAEAKTGLHKTQMPNLSIPAMLSLLEAVDVLGNSAQKTKVLPADPDKTVVAGKAVPPPEKLATAEVNEGNRFEHPEIFRDHDIRGIADKQLTPDTVTLIGKAIGSEAASRGIRNIVVGRDGRLSSERIQKNLLKGLSSTGCNVIDIGLVPAPVLYYAISKLNTNAGIMITGGHNPAEYNGFRIILDGNTLQGIQILNLLKRIEKYNFTADNGSISTTNVLDDYSNEICADIIMAKPLKVVLDASNGAGSDVTTQLFSRLDCEVIPLNCTVDGKFPGHQPDPSRPENLASLIENVKSNAADIGIALDGAADRLVAVTASGRIIDGDQLLMIFARDIVSRNPATSVVYDPRCSRNISKIVTEFGGRPIMCKSGHPYIKAKMQETEALLGGEFSGEYFFSERWYGFADGIYAALRLVELLTTDETTLDERAGSLPASAHTGELVIPGVKADDGIRIIARLRELLAAEAGNINTTDGLRIDYDSCWGLVRLSSSTDLLTARFEADNDNELQRIQTIFRNALLTINPKLQLPF